MEGQEIIPVPEGHTGLWPRKRRRPRERGLAVYTNGSITDEYGQTWPVSSWDDYCDIQADFGLDIYTGSLIDPDRFPFLLDAIADGNTTVMASENGSVLGVSVARGSKRYWTGASNVWLGNPGPDLVATLRRLFNYAAMGTYATPGALGEQLWSRTRTEYASVPCAAACADLRANMYGGRADTPGLGRQLAQAYEIDLRSAYVALAARVPTGTAERMIAEESWMRYGNHCTFYAECDCTLPRRDRGVGVIPYRTGDMGSGRPHLTYPTTHPKRFTSWLWREEVQRARRSGVKIQVGRGWLWRRWDTDNAGWIRLVTDLRADAPDPLTAQLLKLASVAAIGRQGRAPINYSILWGDDPRLSEDDIPLPNPVAGEPPITGAWLHREIDPRPMPRLPHWFNYITMRCRLALYDRMQAERRAGNAILMTNFDSILLEQASTLPTGEGVGDWRQTRLTNVRIVAARSFTSDQKIRLPGVPRLDETE